MNIKMRANIKRLVSILLICIAIIYVELLDLRWSRNETHSYFVIMTILLIFCSYIYAWWLDSHPQNKQSQYLQKNHGVYVSIKFMIYVTGILIVAILFQLILHVNIDELEVRFWDIFLMVTWMILIWLILFYEIGYFLILLKQIFSVEKIKKYDPQNGQYLIKKEVVYVLVILAITMMIMFAGVSLSEKYLEVKNIDDLYKLIVGGGTEIGKTPQEFKTVVSYVIQDLSFYTSFFSILTISLIMPLVHKFLLKTEKNEKEKWV